MVKRLKKHYQIYIIIITIILIIICFLCLLIFNHNLVKVNKNYQNLSLANVDNLLIIAHPSDEIIWAGGHLLEKNYLVVCLSCGENKESLSTARTLKYTKDPYIFLGYPEKNKDENIIWSKYNKEITKDLQKIISLKKWSQIITHNPEGEYQNSQHKYLSTTVTSLVKDKNKLYYFGKYYSQDELVSQKKGLMPLSENIFLQKEQLLSYYPQDSYLQTSFNHIMAYENWLSHQEWSDEFYEDNE